MSAEKPCERCVFVPTPDGVCICREVEVHVCLPSLGEACGNCHRCLSPEGLRA